MSSIDDESTMVMKNEREQSSGTVEDSRTEKLSSKFWLCHSLGLSLLAKHKLSEPQSIFAVKW